MLEVILFKLLFRYLELGVLLDEEGSGCLGLVFTFTRRMLFLMPGKDREGGTGLVNL